jgi:hypothetical protein
VRAVVVGDWDAAISLGDAGLAHLSRFRREAQWEGEVARTMPLLALEATLRPEQLRLRSSDAHRGAVERNDRFAQVTVMLSSAFSMVIAGDPRGARLHARDALALWSRRDGIQRVLAIHAEVYADLYEGRPAAALRGLADGWPIVQSSQMLRAQIGRMKLYAARAQASLALAAEDASRRPALLRDAARDVDRIAKEIRSDARPTVHLLHAGLAGLRGQPDRALAELASAITGFDAARMPVHAAIARRRKGELLNGDEGRALVTSADAVIAGAGIREPAIVAAMLAPAVCRA